MIGALMLLTGLGALGGVVQSRPLCLYGCSRPSMQPT